MSRPLALLCSPHPDGVSDSVARLVAEGAAEAGADWQIFRLHWLQGVVKVDRLDTAGQALSTERVPTRAFYEHRLIRALATGQLFTPPVGCPN